MYLNLYARIKRQQGLQMTPTLTYLQLTTSYLSFPHELNSTYRILFIVILLFNDNKQQLGSMPLIDTSFKRVAVDIVGLIATQSEAGH